MHTYLSILKLVFQSTPSVWRETIYIIHHLRTVVFQSTPSVWRETRSRLSAISQPIFQSTPSVWRETYNASEYDLMWGISIHSLRMEGDGAITTPGYVGDISIHSLRMEGDSRHCACGRSQLHFNPLPPHGGRLPFSNRRFTDSTFQSTPSAWRETHWHNGQSITRQFQSTPSAWRETSQVLGVDLSGDYFNPLPPHGGRPSR